METQITEIATNIYRLSTYVADADFMFNQFLVVDDEPLLFQTGLRKLFPLVSDAVGRLIPIEQLRWITFGHVEADECGVDEPMVGRISKRSGRAWSAGVPDFGE